MASHEVYLPVMVTLDDGRMIHATVEFEGAPWMYVDSEANVWDVNAEEDDGAWIRDTDIETTAIEALEAVLTAHTQGAHA